MTPEIIIGSSEFKGFLQNWRGALRDRETIDRDYWEGRLAYAELKRTGYLQRLRFAEGDDNGITPRRQLPKICSAIDAYRRDTNRVRHLNDLQKSHVEWLEKKEREFERKARNVANINPSFGADLQLLAEHIREVMRGASLDLISRWKHNSGFTLPIKGHEKMSQERQLDSQFQVRLGAVFRSFMPKDPLPREKEAKGPSLRTVARLIVLFLVCAEFAYTEDGRAKLKHNHRPVTVGGVLQQLKGSGLD